MIEHISRSSIIFSFNGRRVVVGGELFLDRPGDWNSGCFEVSSQSLCKWESGDDISAEDKESLLRALVAEVEATRKLRRIEIY
ncbi:MAG: hypothetical protein ACK5NY_06135 [Burkholderiaceae bacterium]